MRARFTRTRRIPRRWLAISLGVGAGLLVPSCGGKKSTDVTLNDPNDLRHRPEAGWVEFDVIGGGCPAEDALKSGAISGAPSFVVGATDAIPGVGDLPSGTYGFAVLVKDQSCAIMGYGCTEVDLASKRAVTINVQPNADANHQLAPIGGCMAPAACVAGTCGMATDGGAAGGAGGGGGGGGGMGGGSGGKAGSGGAPSMGCKLELIKSGDLPPPIDVGATIAGPAVVATPTGFLIGYRDLNAGATMDRVNVVAVTSDGVAAQPSPFALTPCAATAVDPTVAMAINDDGTSGLLAASRPPCKNAMVDGGVEGAGVTFVRFNGGGQIQDGKPLQGEPGFPAISLASSHALAHSFAPYDFRVTYVQSGSALTFPLVGVLAAPGALFVPVFDPLVGTSAISTASSADVLLQAGSVTTDGGAQTAVRIEPKGVMAKTVFRDPAAAYAATAFGPRSLLVARDATGNLGWTIFAGDATVVTSGTIPMGPYKGFDTAVVNDHLIFVAAQNLGFTLFGAKGATKMPAMTPELSVTVKSDKVPNLASFDGTQIAVAASQGAGRVLVAWASRSQLGAKDPTGGYAVFRCEP